MPDRRNELEDSAGPVVLLGGAVSPQGTALREFIKLCKNRRNGRIVCLTTASGDPQASARQWMQDFHLAGCKRVEIPIVATREHAMSPEIAEMCANADGIFLGGGDQIKLVSTLSGTPIENAIRDVHLRGIVVGGTSAGAAALSKTTLAGNEIDEFGELVRQYVGPGLGFIRQQSIIDTHFSQRRRLYRLFIAVAQFPEVIGLGIDEDTGLIVEGDTSRVVGTGGVTFVDGRGVRYSNANQLQEGASLTISAMRVGIIGSGHRFNLHKRELITALHTQKMV